VPTADGSFRMVDLSTYEAEPEKHFNAATDVIFFLFNRANPTNGIRIGLNDAPSLVASGFNRDHPTRLTIHGWHGDVTHMPNVVMANAYLSRGDFNVIAVDWGAGE
jgi:pancreatic triacylglycerol lipase